MKVLFVYKFLTMGGVETVLRVRLEGLPAYGIEPHAWFLFDGPGRVIFEGLESRVHVGSTAMLRDFLSHYAIDLLSSLDTEEIFPTLHRLHPRPKLVIEAHSPYMENLEYLRYVGDLPVSTFFVPSQYQADIIRPKIGKEADVRVIPNPLAVGFEAELVEFSPAPPHPVLAWIGRLDDLKNWKEFVEIAGVVRKQRDDIEFWIVGKSGGEDISQKLYDQAKRKAIHDRLRWFRGLPYKHIPRLLDAVRTSGGLVLSTSKGDSFGMTVAEAMARSCAVIVPSDGPFNEFVNEGIHGDFYTLGSIKEAVFKIHSILEDDERRGSYGLQGRKDILKRYGAGMALKDLASELEELVAS